MTGKYIFNSIFRKRRRVRQSEKRLKRKRNVVMSVKLESETGFRLNCDVFLHWLNCHRKKKREMVKINGRKNLAGWIHFIPIHSTLDWDFSIENTPKKKRIANDWLISWLRILVILYIREWSNQEQQNSSSCISLLTGFYFLFFVRNSFIHSFLSSHPVFVISSLPPSPFLFLPPLGIKLTLRSRWKFITRDSC